MSPLSRYSFLDRMQPTGRESEVSCSPTIFRANRTSKFSFSCIPPRSSGRLKKCILSHACLNTVWTGCELQKKSRRERDTEGLVEGGQIQCCTFCSRSIVALYLKIGQEGRTTESEVFSLLLRTNHTHHRLRSWTEGNVITFPGKRGTY